VGEGRFLVPRGYDYRIDYRIPASRLRSIIKSYLGVPYRYGGTSRRGLDCSGFVNVVFKELNRARVPRTTRRLRKLGKQVPLGQAALGDLVFFRMGSRGTVDHVGIWVGEGRFAHASQSKGITYSRIDQEYYRKRFAYLRRVF
jgi:cell wall-associated NlpC family hydrolase